MERSRGYGMRRGSLGRLAERGTSTESATPVPWRQCDASVRAHASSSCIVASGLGWGAFPPGSFFEND